MNNSNFCLSSQLCFSANQKLSVKGEEARFWEFLPGRHLHTADLEGAEGSGETLSMGACRMLVEMGVSVTEAFFLAVWCFPVRRSS